MRAHLELEDISRGTPAMQAQHFGFALVLHFSVKRWPIPSAAPSPQNCGQRLQSKHIDRRGGAPSSESTEITTTVPATGLHAPCTGAILQGLCLSAITIDFASIQGCCQSPIDSQVAKRQWCIGSSLNTIM